MDTAPGFTGVARFARRGDDAASSLRAGDIAVVDLTDLGRGQAEALVDRRVRAVVNAAQSSTGLYPNLGPRILADAGITLVDQVGQGVWNRLKSGETIRIDGNRVFKGEMLVAQGVSQDDATVTASLGEADRGLSTRLESLMANVTDHLQRERALLLEGARVPRLGKRLRKRPVVVVSKAFGWQNDLRRIRRWIRERDPVLIGVAGGADALLDAGYKPHVVLGALDELSVRALNAGAEVIVTASSDHEKSGAERFEKAGVDPVWFIATGSATDLAIVLADSNDAPVVVEVGAPTGLMEFLERGPADVASSFVTRLRAGSRLVDAKAASHFAAQAMPMWPVLLILLAGVAAVFVAVAITPVGGDWLDSLGERTDDARTWIEGLFS
ncbi:MAG: putative cytokinetic ring protein SteA [Aeromicrobium sp.]